MLFYRLLEDGTGMPIAEAYNATSYDQVKKGIFERAMCCLGSVDFDNDDIDAAQQADLADMLISEHLTLDASPSPFPPLLYFRLLNTRTNQFFREGYNVTSDNDMREAIFLIIPECELPADITDPEAF